MPDLQSCTLHSLPYRSDSSGWLARVRDLGGAAWLDSAHPFTPRGRFDVISAAPLAWLEQGDTTAGADPFTQVQARMDEILAPCPAPGDLPFCGGAIGLFGYELGAAGGGVPGSKPADSDLPQLQAGIYSWAVISDHLRRQSHLLIHPATPPALARELRQRLVFSPEPAPARPTPFRLTGPWRESLPEREYRHAFERIQAYIQAGDCYQVNLSRHQCAPCEGDPWSAYLRLREVAAAPFSAYLESPAGAVLSLSPERLLQIQGDTLLTQPIKGTAPRSADPAEDAALARALLASAKNRAENLMIVDLLRNDLGQSCEPGSIRVEQLFELQSFATVHHLVSSISGRLRREVSPAQALARCFPGGSITGAPKRRAMQIIDELEPHRRSVYCGAIGYLSRCGLVDTNIAIRTLLATGGRLHAWSGGGIVADSRWEEELEESRDKIGALLEALTGSTESLRSP